MRRTSQKWYNMQYINMSGKLPMGIAANLPQVRYSAAYPTDAPEKLCFGGKPHEVRPKGPQGAARGAYAGVEDENYRGNLLW